MNILMLLVINQQAESNLDKNKTHISENPPFKVFVCFFFISEIKTQ